MNKLIIDEKIFNKLIGYLTTRPYGEVFELLNIIRTDVKRFKQPDEVLNEVKSDQEIKE